MTDVALPSVPEAELIRRAVVALGEVAALMGHCTGGSVVRRPDVVGGSYTLPGGPGPSAVSAPGPRATNPWFDAAVVPVDHFPAEVRESVCDWRCALVTTCRVPPTVRL